MCKDRDTAQDRGAPSMLCCIANTNLVSRRVILCNDIYSLARVELWFESARLRFVQLHVIVQVMANVTALEMASKVQH